MLASTRMTARAAGALAQLRDALEVLLEGVADLDLEDPESAAEVLVGLGQRLGDAA